MQTQFAFPRFPESQKDFGLKRDFYPPRYFVKAKKDLNIIQLQCSSERAVPKVAPSHNS